MDTDDQIKMFAKVEENVHILRTSSDQEVPLEKQLELIQECIGILSVMEKLYEAGMWGNMHKN